MFAKERQNKIYELLKSNGAVTTSGLIQRFGVSIETIRRDLLYMEEKGLLSRVHGGAVTTGGMTPSSTLAERHKEYSEQKQELALKATEFIQDGDTIGIDTGSTAIYLALAIKERLSRLTVITHSLDVFDILHGCNDFTVILCGGYYMEDENSFYGSLTLEAVSRLHMQKSFIFPSAISIDCGIYSYSDELYQLQKQYMKCSDEIYFLADSSKFEKKALLKVDDVKGEYIYITDGRLSDELKMLYKENDIDVFTGGIS